MKNKEKNFISAVVYIHNNENTIKYFLNNLIQILEDNFEHSEIICVNDCSTDNSVKTIKETSHLAKTTSISILNLSYFNGLETSMNAGVDLSIGDFVYEFDTTNVDYEFTEIINIYKKSLEGFDIVCACPDKNKKTFSKLFYKLFNKFSNTNYSLSTETFRILSRRSINRVNNINNVIPYRKAVYSNCGLKKENYFYNKVDSKTTDISKDTSYKIKLATDSLILFTDLGYNFSLFMTGLMMLLSVLMGGYSIIIYLLGIPVAGWTTTVFFLSIAFFGLFAILSIIVKYLQLIVNIIYKRNRYTFESIEKITK